jgi:hypothetical protein
VQSIEVEFDSMLVSDHYPMTLQILNSAQTNQIIKNQNSFRDYKNANWENFKESLHSTRIDSSLDADNLEKSILKSIQVAIDISVPVKTQKLRTTSHLI